MNMIKRLSAGVALVAALAVTTAEAQLGVPPKFISSGTNQILQSTVLTNSLGSGGLTTTNWPVCVIDCTGSKELALQWTSSMSSTGAVANAIQLWFYRSVSYPSANVLPANYETTAPYFIWGITPNGTTQVSAVTNLTVAGVPYLVCQSVTNAITGTSSITNFTLAGYTTKK